MRFCKCSCVTSNAANSTPPWSKRKRETTTRMLYNPVLFVSDLFLHFPFVFNRREGGGEMLRGRVGRCRLRKSDHISFTAPRCKKQRRQNGWAPQAWYKGVVIRFYVSSDSSCDMPYASWDTTTIAKTGPTIVIGSAKAEGLKVKPIDWVRAAQNNQSEG
jgi:hypothetical protein